MKLVDGNLSCLVVEDALQLLTGNLSWCFRRGGIGTGRMVIYLVVEDALQLLSGNLSWCFGRGGIGTGRMVTSTVMSSRMHCNWQV